MRATVLGALLVVVACGGDDEVVSDASLPVDATVVDARVLDAALECDDVVTDRIVAGWSHSLAIDPTQTIWSWGVNSSGQLGLGDIQDRWVAERVEVTGPGWVSFAAGSRHTCAIRSDKTLWCWGVNVHGQLGVGDTDTRNVPTRVGTDADWEEVVCGGLHTCARRTDNSVWCFGADPVGQLGLGDAVTGDQWLPQQVPGPTTWTRLTAKARHTCGLRDDLSLWCWGDNSDGQLGLGDEGNFRTSPERVGTGDTWDRLGAGILHTCAIDLDDELYCWGANGNGQLGLGDTDPRTQPARVGTDSDWSSAAGGFAHSCGLRGDALYCWGDGAMGKLGLGDSEPRLVPTEVGAGGWAELALGGDHSCGRRAGGLVQCWGANAWGMVGSGDTSPRDLPNPVCFLVGD